ncbi:MAG: glycosyltransferase family 1 protein [Candidatus Binataceae bacterium]
MSGEGLNTEKARDISDVLGVAVESLGRESVRIGIDGRAFMGRTTGVGRYVTELCKHLDELLPNARFFVYAPCPITLPISSDRWLSRVDRSWMARRLNRGLWLVLSAGHFCRLDDLDVFWGAVTLLPKLAPKIRAVTTVYDLNHIVVPRSMRARDLWARRLLFGRSLARADAILAISAGTCARLRATYGYCAAVSVPPGVSSEFAAQSSEAVALCLRKYNVNPPYLLAVGTREPRKNFELLVNEFVQMKKKGLVREHSLVLAGGKGWKDKGLRQLLASSAPLGVYCLDYVDQQDMPALYTGAGALVFPSLYEGFGMPLLEARACGTRVIATDTPELREAGGTGAIYIEPTPNGIRDGISSAIAMRAALDRPRQELNSWRDGARILAQALMGQMLPVRNVGTLPGDGRGSEGENRCDVLSRG